MSFQQNILGNCLKRNPRERERERFVSVTEDFCFAGLRINYRYFIFRSYFSSNVSQLHISRIPSHRRCDRLCCVSEHSGAFFLQNVIILFFLPQDLQTIRRICDNLSKLRIAQVTSLCSHRTTTIRADWFRIFLLDSIETQSKNELLTY